MTKESWNPVWPDAFNWPEPTKSSSLRCDLLFMTNSIQKTKISNDSFQGNCWSKNSAIQFNKKLNWPHSTKMWLVSDATFPWWLTACKKKYDINWFSPKMLMIKESCSLIAWKVNLVISYQTTTFLDTAFAWRQLHKK